MTKIALTVSEGAGEDFIKTVADAVEDGTSTVMIQVAGEYGHLIVESIEDIVPDDWS